jgi:ketosteroid isomerase-like protein
LDESEQRLRAARAQRTAAHFHARRTRRPAYDCAADLAAFIERYDHAWNEQDVDAIMSMHTPDMVFENHTRGMRAEGPAVRELLESTFADSTRPAVPGRRRYVGDDVVVSEWTASAMDPHDRCIEWDGIDVFPFRKRADRPQERLLRFRRSARALERSSHRRERQTLRVHPLRPLPLVASCASHVGWRETPAGRRCECLGEPNREHRIASRSDPLVNARRLPDAGLS